MRAARSELEYRRGVGIMLLNRDDLAFVGHRIRMPAGLAKWQMPQGGIDPNETPTQARCVSCERRSAPAALRSSPKAATGFITKCQTRLLKR